MAGLKMIVSFDELVPLRHAYHKFLCYMKNGSVHIFKSESFLDKLMLVLNIEMLLSFPSSLSVPCPFFFVFLWVFKSGLMYPRLDSNKQYCVAEDDLQLLILLSPPSQILGMHCHAQLIQFWEWNPELHACWANILINSASSLPSVSLFSIPLRPDRKILSVGFFVVVVVTCFLNRLLLWSPG